SVFKTAEAKEETPALSDRTYSLESDLSRRLSGGAKLELPASSSHRAAPFNSENPRKSSDPALLISTSSTRSAPPDRKRLSRVSRVDRKQHLEQMFHAARIGELETLTALMRKQEIDLNVQDKEGWTVMHHASFMGQSNIVHYLIDSGFDIGTKNKFGRTPLHLAAEWDNDEVVELLLSRKADIHEPDNDGCTPLECAGELSRNLMENQS
ncbi:hypothetical protein FOZ62_013332, partial [Perkinsus olseni]